MISQEPGMNERALSEKCGSEFRWVHWPARKFSLLYGRTRERTLLVAMQTSLLGLLCSSPALPMFRQRQRPRDKDARPLSFHSLRLVSRLTWPQIVPAIVILEGSCVPDDFRVDAISFGDIFIICGVRSGGNEAFLNRGSTFFIRLWEGQWIQWCDLLRRRTLWRNNVYSKKVPWQQIFDGPGMYGNWVFLN